jgi:hypothetical protein
MTCVLEKSTRRFLWRIRTLALIISVVLVFGSTPVFARGGGHGGGHSAGMVVTLVATEDIIMEVMSATSLEGLQAAQRQGVTLRVRVLVPRLIRFQRIAPNLTKKQWQTIPAEKAHGRFVLPFSYQAE